MCWYWTEVPSDHAGGLPNAAARCGYGIVVFLEVWSFLSRGGLQYRIRVKMNRGETKATEVRGGYEEFDICPRDALAE